MKPVVFRGNQGRWFFTQYIFKLSHGVIVKAYVISSQGVMVQIPGRKIGLELLCKKTNNNNKKKKTNKLHTHTKKPNTFLLKKLLSCILLRSIKCSTQV